MAALAAASRYPGLNSILFYLWPKIKKKPPNYNTPYIRVNTVSINLKALLTKELRIVVKPLSFETTCMERSLGIMGYLSSPPYLAKGEALLPFSPAMHASFQRVHPNFTISPISIYLHQSSYTSTDPQLSLFRSIHVHSPLSTFIHLHQPTSTFRRPHRLRTASISEILRARNWIYVMQKPNFS